MTGSLLFVVFTLGAPGLKESKKDSGIVGEWKIEKLTVAGEDEPHQTEPDFLLFDSDGKFFHRKGPTGKLTEGGTYVVDLTASPTTIDMKRTESGGVWKGIFKIEGDTLTVCLTPLSKANRPRAFESKNNSIDLLYVMKRVKKKD